MTVSAMEIRHNKTASGPSLGLDMGLREALATYVKLRWPTATAKMAAREWDLTLDEGKGLVNGRTSLATLERIIKHRNGGWDIAFAVVGAVAHETAEDFLASRRKQHVELARRHSSLVRDIRAGGHTDRDGPPELDRSDGGRWRSFRS
jgi:hypothetical protein